MQTTTSKPNSDSVPARPSPDRSNAIAEAARDVILVRRFNGGDSSAFLEIMENYREKTYRIARSVVRNHPDAEEITQDTFLRAHRALAHFRGESSLATWLRSVTLNLARNRYWFNFRRRQHAMVSLDSPLRADAALTFSDLLADGSATPERETVSTEFTGVIEACMARLAPSHREILTLRNVLQTPYAAIGVQLGITVGTVKSRIARARCSLRALVSEMCPEFAPETELAEWFEPTRANGLCAVA
ncbi:MAG: RNA polymerase sigma factor [Opitutaceae bacterium]